MPFTDDDLKPSAVEVERVYQMLRIHKLMLFTLACSLATLGYCQDLAGFTVGSDFDKACKAFFSIPYITPDKLSTPDECSDDDNIFPRTLLGETTFLGLPYFVAIDEFNGKIEDVAIASTGFREYTQDQLDNKIHSELYALQQYLSKYLGEPDSVKELSSRSFDNTGERMDIMTWENNSEKASVTVARHSTSHFIVVAKLISLSVEAQHDKANRETSEKVDKLLNLHGSDSKSNDASVVASFTGSGGKNTVPFTTNGPWEAKWDVQGDIFQLYLYAADGSLVDILANQQGAGAGSSYWPKAGSFYLKVNTVGNWEIKIVPMQ